MKVRSDIWGKTKFRDRDRGEMTQGISKREGLTYFSLDSVR